MTAVVVWLSATFRLPKVKLYLLCSCKGKAAMSLKRAPQTCRIVVAPAQPTKPAGSGDFIVMYERGEPSSRFDGGRIKADFAQPRAASKRFQAPVSCELYCINTKSYSTN
jgi:hypothetical protein